MNNAIGPEWEAAHIDHLSPSQLLRSPGKWIFEYLYLSKEERRQQGVGWRAVLGTAAHDAIQGVLCHAQDIDSVKTKAQAQYDGEEGDEDTVMRDRLREALPGVIDSGIKLLAEAGYIGAKSEQYISVNLRDVTAPVIGYVDLLKPGQPMRFCEMKTKGPRKTKVLKDGSQGWAKASLPKAPEWSHVCQAAIYQAAVGGQPEIAYLSEGDAVLFTADNCDELRSDALIEALAEMRQRALLRQNLLKISRNPRDLAAITDPDWGHMYQWKIKPEFYNKARALWGL